MKLLNTYDDKDDAEAAAAQLQGEKRLPYFRHGDSSVARELVCS